MNINDVLQQLEMRVKATSQGQVALDFGVSAQYVSDVRRQRRAVGPKILNGLGLAKSIDFVAVKPRRTK